jgi:hypothetical protein
MGLRGQFSNPPRPLSDLLFHSLTGLEEHIGLRDVKSTAGWPDGRRRFGTVSGAIVRVLAEAEGELPVRAIRTQVERLLDGPVSRFSVSDYLLVRSKSPQPLFERTRRGHYRLLR